MKDQKVLLIEDNRTDAMLICLCLKKIGIPLVIDHRATTDEALIYISEHSEPAHTAASSVPNLIVLDLNLPGRGGHAILREIRSTPAFKMVPVIIFSTSSYKEDILTSYELGANDYVTKPADFSTFRTVLETSVLTWLSSDTLQPTAQVPVKERHLLDETG